MVASYIMNILDLSLYASTTCEDLYSKIPMYFNFAMLIFVKIGVFNYITSEINVTLQYDLKFPFLIPIIATGVIANFQLPLILYNYKTCNLRTPVLKLSMGYFIIDAIAVVISVGFLIMVLSLIFNPKIKISHVIIKMFRTVFYFLCICSMLVLNCLFIFISLTQANHFSMTLLTENLLYWTLVLSGFILYILRRKYKIEMFRPIEKPREHKNHDELQGFIIHGGEKTDSINKGNTLEKIQVKRIENKEGSLISLKNGRREEAESLDQEPNDKDGRRWTFAGPVVVKGV